MLEIIFYLFVFFLGIMALGLIFSIGALWFFFENEYKDGK
tara:strand:- start:2374 stop:2493 length:120 start_codon:yes stop_codon:yes gene_type:complete